MGAQKSHKGKGSYATYRSSNCAGQHKEARENRQQRLLAKRKAWRIEKYGKTPQIELSGTTVKLFKHWGVALIGPKKGKHTITQQPESDLTEFIKNKTKHRR